MYDYKQKKFPLVFENSYENFLRLDLTDGLYHIDDEHYFDVLIKNFHPDFHRQKKILVCFSAAVSKRSHKVGPFFSGENIASALGLPLIAFADPVVSSKDLTLGWYIGASDNLDYSSKIVRFLRCLVERYSCELIFFGGSGGGFASLNYASLLGLPAKCLAMNPQIKIENYNGAYVDRFLRIAFGCTNNFSTNEQKGSFLSSQSVNHDITQLDHSKVQIIYLQNKGDKLHVEEHLSYFIRGKKLMQTDESTFLNDNLALFYGNWGQGHAGPERHIVQNVLAKLAKNVDLLKCLDNMDTGAPS